jgi:prephenate dehydrogenase
MSGPRIERLAIAGVGLIGGSLALAAREAGLVGEVVGWGRTAANLETARARGIVDRVAATPADAVAGADVVVLAAPVRACAPLAEAFRPHAKRGALLTDVGSVKGELVAALEPAWASVGPFVGAHPIAGSEASGAAAARADLFRHTRCIVTPTPATDGDALRRVRVLWEAVGATVVVMTPAMHDGILARVSHMPHLVAYALAAAVGGATVEGAPVLPYAGPGFRDTTRIAGSPAELWRDIMLANADALGAALREFRAELDRLAVLIESGDGAALGAALDAARELRRKLGSE